MSEQLISSVFTVLTAIIGVAIIAIILSKNSATSAVLQSGGGAFSTVLGTALSPVTSQNSFNIGRGVGSLGGNNFGINF